VNEDSAGEKNSLRKKENVRSRLSTKKRKKKKVSNQKNLI
jgi:hypothetical protein